MHDRVADQREREDVLRYRARFARHIACKVGQRRADGERHLLRAARVHHRVGDAAHEVFAEADLRVHHPGGRHHFAGREVAKMRGDGRRTHIDRHAERPLVEARPQADDLAPRLHRCRHLPLACPQRRLQRSQHTELDAETGELPFALERFRETTQITRRIVHVRLADLDIVQTDEGIEVDLTHFCGLAHDLTVDLARRRHIDHHIAADFRLTGEPLTGFEHLATGAARLDLGGRRDAGLARAYAVLGELACGDHHLATTADTASAADGVDVDPELARRLQERRAEREPPALAGGQEHDKCVSFTHRSLP